MTMPLHGLACKLRLYIFLAELKSKMRFKMWQKPTLYSSCGVKWNPSGEDPMMHMTYVFFIYMFGFIIPVTVIFTSYFKIIKTIKLKVSGDNLITVEVCLFHNSQ